MFLDAFSILGFFTFFKMGFEVKGDVQWVLKFKDASIPSNKKTEV